MQVNIFVMWPLHLPYTGCSIFWLRPEAYALFGRLAMQMEFDPLHGKNETHLAETMEGLKQKYPLTAPGVITMLSDVNGIRPRLAPEIPGLAERVMGATSWYPTQGIELYSRLQHLAAYRVRQTTVAEALRFSDEGQNLRRGGHAYSDAIHALRPFIIRLHSSLGSGFGSAFTEVAFGHELDFLCVVTSLAAMRLIGPAPSHPAPWFLQYTALICGGNPVVGFDARGFALVLVK
jgi:hypothetical protein